MDEQVVSRSSYVAVFAALIVLTAVTVSVALVDLGVMNPVAAMTIAVVKALLVVTIFMNLRHSARLIWLVAGASLFWLLILFALLLGDYLMRTPVTPYPPM